MNLEPALKGQPVRVVDATVVKEPGKTGGQWRIHYSMRLPSLECDQFDLTPVAGKGTGEGLGRFKFHAGELVLADAGYSHPAGIAKVVEEGADLCVRMNRRMLPLRDEKDRAFPLPKKLETLRRPGETAEWRVWVPVGQQRIAGRVCVVRKSEEAIERAHRRLVRRQQVGKGFDTPENREYACYVLVFTTLPKKRARIMLLLNVSDIHFRHPLCHSAMDPDRPYRTRLVQDVRARVAMWGNVGAILVGGDIAFAGLAEEYEAAYQWLQQLAAACGCPLERIFVIPGNHDVDRRVIQNNLSCRNALRAVANANQTDRERELFQQFQNADTGRDLLASIETYNAFAARFNCQVYTPERLFWHQDLPLDERTMLRIYGLTSTLLSWSSGRDDRQLDLYLSPLQTALNPLDGYVNVVMCHHPPDWCMDNDEIEDAIRGRAGIQFFGHKHRQRITRDPYFIRFSSGAVNPDRREVGWEPGYNLVRLSTSEDGTERFLDIEAQLLVWQTNPDTFRPKQAEPGDVFRHRLRIRGSVPCGHMVMGAAAISSVSESQSVVEAVTMVEQETVEPTMTDDKTRNLVLRFWNLASSERRGIALHLGLIEPEDIRLPEAERYGRAFQRAGQRGLLERIAEEIQTRERI